MASWSDLLDDFYKLSDGEKGKWLNNRLDEQLKKVSNRRKKNVIVYASGFLQKTRGSVGRYIDQPRGH